MDISYLIKTLDEMGVPKRYYSINENLASDTYILNEIYGKWEYFYFDEKGNRNNYHIFENENDACIYMLDILKTEVKYRRHQSLDT